MKREVRISNTARRGLLRLVDFVSGKDSDAASRSRQVIVAGMRSLEELAGRGRRLPVAGLRELVVNFGKDAYLIRYRIDGTVVVIARVTHSKERR